MARLALAAPSLFLLLLGAALPSHAGEADVIKVERRCDGSVCAFDVTVRHDDAGWDHYVTRWEVVDEDGDVFGIRELAHPHVDEQPFTRSLSGVRIPEDIYEVTVRAYDSVHGYGGKTITVSVPEDADTDEDD